MNTIKKQPTRRTKTQKNALILIALAMGLVLVASQFGFAQAQSYNYGPNSTLQSNNNPSTGNNSAANLFQTYNSTTLRFSVTYPGDWMYYDQPDGGVTFNQNQNDPTMSNASVDIASISGTDLNSAVNSIKNQYLSDPMANAQISNDQSFMYTMADGTKLNGISFQVNYNFDTTNVSYRDLVMVIARGNQNLVWTYSTPVSQFSNYLAVNQAMFNSWMINK